MSQPRPVLPPQPRLRSLARAGRRDRQDRGGSHPVGEPGL